MLVYYSKSNISKNLSILSNLESSKLESNENKIESEQDVGKCDLSKKLIFSPMFSTFIELIELDSKINIFDINLTLINTINLENRPITVSIFENTLAILFCRNVRDKIYYINLYNSDGININKINEINIGYIFNVHSCILILNQNKILYLKEKARHFYGLFLFDISTNEEYDLGVNSSHVFKSANWIDNYIMCCKTDMKKIKIHDSNENLMKNEIIVKYKIWDILSTYSKIIITTTLKTNIIEIYNKNFPYISLIDEIDLNYLINSKFLDFKEINNIIPSSVNDELFILYETLSDNSKIIKLDLNTHSLELIKEFDVENYYIFLVLYLPAPLLQLW